MPAIPGLASPGELRQLSTSVSPDLRSFALAMSACMLVAVLCSLAPGWHCSRRPIHDVLKGVASRKRSPFHSALCAFEIALSGVPLVSASLMARTVLKLYAIDAGFDTDHVVTFSIDPRMRRYTGQQNWSLQQRLLDGIRALPGVRAAGISGRPLMRGVGLVTTLTVTGAPDDARFNTSMNVASPGYFDAMGISLLSGRDFQQTDNIERQRAPIIVNGAFVRRFFNGADPIGRSVGWGLDNQPQYEIIGVTSDAHYRSLREIPPPTFYRPFSANEPANGFVLNVRTNIAPESIIKSVRNVLKSIDPGMPIFETATLRDEVDRSLWQERLTAVLAICFAAFSVLLSSIGLYGMLSYFVTQHRREFGIRLALGAGARDTFRVIFRRLIPVLVFGLIAGAGLYAAGGKYLESILYGIHAFDLPAMIAALLLILIGCLAASAVPWLRTIRVSPLAVLRDE
jgi:predicted permease